MSSKEQTLRQEVLEAVRRYVDHQQQAEPPFSPGGRIPYAARVYDQAEVGNLVEASLDFWLTAGRFAGSFEQQFADFLGVKHCSLTNSGSSANLLAFMALTSPQLGERRIRRGDEVITVAAGFPTTVAPIIQYGAVPVFVDVSLPDCNIDCSYLEEARTERTRAVMVAHTLGNPFDLRKVKEFCDRHGLWLIEDNCDALGSRYCLNGEWRYTGTIGDIGTSSFYPPHHMTMGEGGAVYTNDTKLKRLVESFRDWGRDCWCPSGRDDTCNQRFSQQFGELPRGYDHKYVYSHFGYNLRVTDMQAAVGCAQLEKLPEFIAARKRNWQHLRDGLRPFEDRLLLPNANTDSDPSWFSFLFLLREESGVERESLVSYLEDHGIQTRMLFGGNLLRQPAMVDLVNEQPDAIRVVGELKNSDRVMRNGIFLGTYPGLTTVMLDHVVETFHTFFQQQV